MVFLTPFNCEISFSVFIDSVYETDVPDIVAMPFLMTIERLLQRPGSYAIHVSEVVIDSSVLTFFSKDYCCSGFL